MARYGYSYVTDKGFSAFARELDAGVWQDVSIDKYDVDDRKPSASLLSAPRVVTWKLRLIWAIRDLDDALGVSPEKLKQLDDEWDASQRALHLYLASEAEHRDPERKGAAERLRGSLLAGAGTEQTTYGYEEEVDFGYQQIARVKKAPLEADASRVGLAAYVTRVEEATDALAKGIGREPGKKRAAPSKRLREAFGACSTAFNAVHEDVAFLIEHARAGKEREHLEALQGPFVALLERYPVKAKSEDAPAGTGEAGGDGVGGRARGARVGAAG